MLDIPLQNSMKMSLYVGIKLKTIIKNTQADSVCDSKPENFVVAQQLANWHLHFDYNHIAKIL